MYTITKEKVENLIKKAPESKKYLELLFPEHFEKDLHFCDLPAVFQKAGGNNLLVVYVSQGYTVVHNLTHNTTWKKYIVGYTPSGDKKTFITRGEAMELFGGEWDKVKNQKFISKV